MLALALTGFGFIVVLILYAAGQRKKAEELQAQLAMQQAVSKVKGLEADIVARATELTVNKAESIAVEKKLHEAKVAAVKIKQDVTGLSPEDVVKAYRDLGY